MRLTRQILGTDGAPTLGYMESDDSGYTCATLERSATGDHPCIPAGTYTVHKARHHPDSPHGYACPELETDAIGRTHIHIHIANRASELLGCIATGERVSDDAQAIEGSKTAFNRLMFYLDREQAWPWTLEIIDPATDAEQAEEQADGTA